MMDDYNVIPITVNDGHKVFDCYMDKRRQLIFPTLITAEFAKELGWTWEGGTEDERKISISE